MYYYDAFSHVQYHVHVYTVDIPVYIIIPNRSVLTS